MRSGIGGFDNDLICPDHQRGIPKILVPGCQPLYLVVFEEISQVDPTMGRKYPRSTIGCF